ncbi:subtilisin-like serine protease, partial [Nowakowskiella sp. JEL0078]
MIVLHLCAFALFFIFQTLGAPLLKRQAVLPDTVGDLSELSASIKGKFIVIFKDNIGGQEVDTVSHYDWLKNITLENSADACILSKFGSGYSAKIPDSIVEKLKSRSEVELVESEQILTLQTQVFIDPSTGVYGLQRISARKGIPKFYTFPDSAGEGIDVYVLDTGVKIDHPDFEGRATNGFDATGEGLTDNHGHGTHVSGTVASKTFGVAKKANIISVKVLTTSGGGTSSQVISGIEFVIKNVAKKGTTFKSVINMSLGSNTVLSVNQAVQKAIDAGIPVVVAAGNQGTDACTQTPASVKQAFSVGAVDNHDNIVGFSNFGSCVDIFAPGTGIFSTSNKGGSESKSGTSMSSPHVAGVVALALSSNLGSFSSVDEVTQFILNQATKNTVIGDIKGSPNLFLFDGGNSSFTVVPSDPSPTPNIVRPDPQTVIIASPSFDSSPTLENSSPTGNLDDFITSVIASSIFKSSPTIDVISSVIASPSLGSSTVDSDTSIITSPTFEPSPSLDIIPSVIASPSLDSETSTTSPSDSSSPSASPNPDDAIFLPQTQFNVTAFSGVMQGETDTV